ncbi:MAG TPA: metallophosphoesterase [Pseudothermotoga sp.]|nr:metallophosphoesterase [Pseudothermotoga sp.]HOK84466.1 metallophosphoesterase [Pseudothermotoga sp.]HPP70932.1 metallophosphoesterase [Pseudothermotoga sp.]
MWMVISDTHDNLPKIKQFVEEAVKRGVTHVFHCGDIVSPFALVELMKGNYDFHGVFGNNDGEVILLNQKSSGRVRKGPLEIVINGYRVLLMHEPCALDALLDSNYYDFIFYGHIHKIDIRRTVKTLLVNPGDASGYLGDQATVAFINPENKEIEIYRV